MTADGRCGACPVAFPPLTWACTEHHSQSASDQFEVGSENTTSQFHRSSSMQNFSAYKVDMHLPVGSLLIGPSQCLHQSLLSSHRL